MIWKIWVYNETMFCSIMIFHHLLLKEVPNLFVLCILYILCIFCVCVKTTFAAIPTNQSQIRLSLRYLLFQAPWWWLCHRHPCRTGRMPLWTQRSVPQSVGQPEIISHLIFFEEQTGESMKQTKQNCYHSNKDMTQHTINKNHSVLCL